MPYVYQETNPLQAFSQGYGLVRGIQKDQLAQQQAEQQAEAQQQRGVALQQAITNIRTNPSPEAIAEFYLQFPEMKEQFDAYRGALAEGDKGTLSAAAREALIASKTGRPAADVFRRYAAAAQNSRNPALAKQFEDAAAMADASPEAAELTTRMFYQGIDPDGYKAVFGSDVQLDTAQIKNLIAEGLTPGTPEFQTALKEERTKVSFFHPDYGFVSGSPDFVQSVFGGAPPADTQKIPRISTQEGYDALSPGAEYIDGTTGKRARKKGKATGGGGSNATGSFRGP
jgi:hypothetical protein